MRVVNWKPIGYQKNIGEDGSIIYQVRVYAELEKIGEFLKDPGGSVVGYDLINICDLNNRIKWGEVGEWLVEKTRAGYGK